MATSNKEFVDSHQYDIMTSMAKDWWDPKGVQGQLQTFNDARVPFICRNLEKMGKIKDANSPTALEGLKILDIGCGGGVLTEALAKLHATVVGVEPVDELTEVAKFHVSNQPDIKNSITYLCETIEEHCVKNQETYDVIIASEVIEHVENKDSFIKSCAAALKKGGDIFFSCPNKTFSSFFFMRLWGELILNIIPRGSHRFDWFIHHDKLCEKLAKFDIHKKELKGFLYLPGKMKWILTSYTGWMYIMHLRKN